MMIGRFAASTTASRTIRSFGRSASRRTLKTVAGRHPQWYTHGMQGDSSPVTASINDGIPSRPRYYSSTSSAPASASPAAAATIPADPDMFCRQCEQARDNVGCSTVGVCGKSPETSNAQDALMHVVKSVSAWCVAARTAGATPDELKDANAYTLKAAFATLTNVNFSEGRIADLAKQGLKVKSNVESLVKSKGGTAPSNPDLATLSFSPNDDTNNISLDVLETFGKEVGVLSSKTKMNHDDAFSLKELATAGAKGVAAYAAHCHQLGYMNDEKIMAPLHEIWAKLGSHEPDFEGLLSACLKIGEINATTMALLDEAHATVLGVPEPTQVRTTAVEGKAILVSGHDLNDLHHILQKTEGTGINVYTHGEMLPAHSYPELKKYTHLVGNYGTAWQNQKLEFAMFPGPIVMTTNCILEPRKVYKDRVYTVNEVGVDGVKHIDGDWSEVIDTALNSKGFPKTVEPAKYHTVGFNHRVVLPLAGKVLDAAKSGQLSRIFLIGGCDGTEGSRNYFTDLAEQTPDDSLILTLGCAKNRVIHNEQLANATLGESGLPRVLDMGQCNDSYSAVVVALELAKALDCDVNDLPLSLAVSHLEQKAAAVLLTLLHLNVKNIRLGPTLPAYLTPNVLAYLSETYNIMPTGDAETDLQAMMAGN